MPTITVTWGEETFSPVQFQSFRVGPFSMQVEVRPGETEEAAFDRAYTLLTRKAEKVREEKAKSFIAAIKSPYMDPRK